MKNHTIHIANRLKKLKGRLDKTPHLLRIIEEIQTQRDTGQVVYLPCKKVVKVEGRSTGKLRSVLTLVQSTRILFR